MKKTILFLAMLVSLAAFSANASRTIKGFVYDANTKAPLSNAKVSVAGTAAKAFTNKQGYYSIIVPNSVVKLIFSDTTHDIIPQICYQTTTLGINKSNVIIVYMVPLIRYYLDTACYDISAYRSKKTTIFDILRNITDFEIKPDGSITHQGTQIAKVQLNDQDLPADIALAIKKIKATQLIEIQVIDDYGDSAQLTSIKSGDPKKTLNFITKKSGAALYSKGLYRQK